MFDFYYWTCILTIWFCRIFVLPLVDWIYISGYVEHIDNQVMYKRIELFGWDAYFRKLMGSKYKNLKDYRKWKPVDNDGRFWRKVEINDII